MNGTMITFTFSKPTLGVSGGTVVVFEVCLQITLTFDHLQVVERDLQPHLVFDVLHKIISCRRLAVYKNFSHKYMVLKMLHHIKFHIKHWPCSRQSQL